MKYYKLTDSNYRTYNGTTWGEGITHRATGEGNKLCTGDAIHVYDHPLKAAFFNPIHADFKDPILWECRVRRIVANDGLKVGVKTCTTLRRVELPKITNNQRVRVAILCALEVYHEKGFVNWAKKWLSGENRAAGAVEAAEAAEATAAAWAARAAARAIWAARAAAWAAAETVAETAAARAARGGEINVVAIIKRALKEEK